MSTKPGQLHIYVSSLIDTGPSHRVVQAALSADGIDVCLCPALLEEINDALARPRLRKRIPAVLRDAVVEDLLILLDVIFDPAAVPAASSP